MATTKKTETKTEAKAVETKTAAKTAETKAAETKAVAEKAPAKKAAAKTTKTAAEKKAPAKKAAAKTTKAAAEKKAPAKKAAATKVDFFVEFGGVQVSVDEVIKNVKLTNGKAAKNITIYLKPEESKAYFVADGDEKEMDVYFVQG